MALSVRLLARPDPLDTQRSLAPSFGPTPSAILHPDPSAGDGDRRQRLRPKFQRHPCFDREKIELSSNHLDIARVTHNCCELLCFGWRTADRRGGVIMCGISAIAKLVRER